MLFPYSQGIALLSSELFASSAQLLLFLISCPLSPHLVAAASVQANPLVSKDVGRCIPVEKDPTPDQKTHWSFVQQNVDKPEQNQEWKLSKYVNPDGSPDEFNYPGMYFDVKMNAQGDSTLSISKEANKVVYYDGNFVITITFNGGNDRKFYLSHYEKCHFNINKKDMDAIEDIAMYSYM